MAVKTPDPRTPEWQRLADKVARSFVADIYPCGKCGYPVIPGFCCTGCGDTNPSETAEEEKADVKG